MLRPCLEPRCPVLVERGRCPQHERAYDRRRGTAAERGYCSAEHLAWRRAVIKRDRSCGDCGTGLLDSRGEPISTAHADHIVPLGDGGTYALSNGAARCRSCHSRKTMGEQRARPASSARRSVGKR